MSHKESAYSRYNRLKEIKFDFKIKNSDFSFFSDFTWRTIYKRFSRQKDVWTKKVQNKNWAVSLNDLPNKSSPNLT
jgi:hypothetical protein